MSKYRQKIEFVDAEQWKGDTESWKKLVAIGLTEHFWEPISMDSFYLKKPYGPQVVKVNDWIFKDAYGFFYAMSDYTFNIFFEKDGGQGVDK